MAAEDGGPAAATERAPVVVRSVFACIGASIAVVGLWVAVLFGAKVLAGAGWAGTPGRLAVETCVDTESASADRVTVRTRWCSGTFRPDDGGAEIEHVTLKGGAGAAYVPPRPGSRCYGDSPDRPWWCKGDRPTSVAVRYLDGQAWMFGSGLLLPGAVALLGLCGFGLGLLLGVHQLVWPAPERRPPWMRRTMYGVGVIGAAGAAGLLLALAFDVNG